VIGQARSLRVEVGRPGFIHGPLNNYLEGCGSFECEQRTAFDESSGLFTRASRFRRRTVRTPVANWQ